MLSANAHEISPVRGEDAPHDAMIAKPFDLRDLLARIQALLGLEWTTDAAPAAGLKARRAHPDEVAELLRLGRIGHVRGIEAKLTEIEAGTPEPLMAEPLLAELRGLVQAYDLPRYMAVLESAALESAALDAAGDGRRGDA